MAKTKKAYQCPHCGRVQATPGLCPEGHEPTELVAAVELAEALEVGEPGVHVADGPRRGRALRD